MGLREANRERTREALAATALQLFGEYGYDAVTIDAVAAAAGVARRTLFRHFATKEDLVLYDHGEYVDAFRRVLTQRRRKEPPIEGLRRAALAVTELLLARKESLLPRLTLVLREPALAARYVQLDQRWNEAILEALAPAAVSPSTELKLRLFAGAAVGALNAGLFVWVRRGGKPDLVAATHSVFDLLENGLGRVVL
jgi:AcrR family transcriptional regulator